MIFRVTFKDPDGPDWCIRDEMANFRREMSDGILTQDEIETACDNRYELMVGALKRFCSCGEYITIEIDTDKNTARVCV